jgi:hypothetical protein
LLALVTVATLAIVRVRRHAPGTGHEEEALPATAAQGDLPAMPVPSPFSRQRSNRRLEPAPRADDRAT